ncbi:MAG: hypothetical protein KatS3mg077_2338 [Candidatus Binatia bacterium]|nr:MAG: hypothetical protein KatS3mg077_2338 [Candidatus Binatia bacterium]
MHDSDLQLKKSHARRLANQWGFSLADALVGTALGLTTMAAVLGLYRVQLYGLRGHTLQTDVQSTARSIVNLMVGEIRRAGADPKCAKTFEGVAEAKRDRLRLLSDLNGSGAIDLPGEDVTYSQSSEGVLSRTTAGTTEYLSDATVRVTNLQFRYFDGSGNELDPGSNGLNATQRGQIRRIVVRIGVQRSAIDPTSQQPLTATVSSGADLRNRFFVNQVGCS